MNITTELVDFDDTTMHLGKGKRISRFEGILVKVKNHIESGEDKWLKISGLQDQKMSKGLAYAIRKRFEENNVEIKQSKYDGYGTIDYKVFVRNLDA